MNKIHLIPVLLSALLGILPSSCKKAPIVKPNIILFLVDDMGWQDTSVPFWKEETPINRNFHTPNMEKLAAKGMKFTSAYACPVCSPTRISLMTGMNATNHKVTNWTLRKNASNDGRNEKLNAPQWNVNGMSPEQGTERTVYAKALPEILRENGYFTIHAGKAHFGAQHTPASNPENIGFDVNIAGNMIGGPGSYLGLQNFSAVWRAGNVESATIWDVPGLEKYHGKDIFLTEAITLEAKEALQVALDREQPFFLYMSHYAVHVPFAEDKRFIQRYHDAEYEPKEAMYAAMVEGMDKSLGDLMEFVAEKDLEENTIILFMSDNGGLTNHGRDGVSETHNLPLRYGKGSLWEGGIREPMIVYQPGVTDPGSVCDGSVIIEDFFPTVLELAGIKLYETPQKIDGVSFTGLLRGQKPEEDKTMVWHFPNFWSRNYDGYGPGSAIRIGDWKLIYTHTNEEFYLYNIKEDIGEQNNLIGEHRDIAAGLAEELTGYLKEQKAQMPIKKADSEPVPWPDTFF
jgi:arylsulfatase A-like enzyme